METINGYSVNDKSRLQAEIENFRRKRNTSLGVGISLSVIAIIAIILIPKSTKVKEIMVPDVSKLSIAAAESKLKEAGFEINEERKEKTSKEIEEGYVIETDPPQGVKRKKGTTVTLIISTGEKGIELENYVGQNFLEVKGKLEAYGIKVVEEKKDVEKDDKDTVKENQILEQRPIAGTKLVEGDTVTLIVPNLVVKYPNFVEEQWTQDAIEKFCKEYEISVTFKEEETDAYPEGTVIKQDRVAGTQVRKGYPLVVTIAKEKAKEVEKEKETTTDETETNTTETN